MRIWAYKSIAYSGVGDRSLKLLYHVLGDETDLEARGWLVRSILKLSEVKSVGEICSLSSIEDHPVLYLAANLDAPVDYLPSIDLYSSDEPTLKWLILNIGYDTAGNERILGDLSIDQALEELAQHEAEYVSQFSLWAKHSRRSNIKLKHWKRKWPSSNRRWLNRILMQNASSRDEFLEVWMNALRDSEATVREGSYKELLDNPKHLPSALDFGDRLISENDQRCRNLCLRSLAIFSNFNPDYGQLFKEVLKSSILNSSDLNLLWAMKVRPQNKNMRKLKMVDKSVNISNISGSAISVGGDAKNSAKNSVLTNEKAREEFNSLFEKLRREDIDAEAIDAIEKLANAAIEDPSEEKTHSLATVINKSIEQASNMAGQSTKIIGLFEKLAELAKSL